MLCFPWSGEMGLKPSATLPLTPLPDGRKTSFWTCAAYCISICDQPVFFQWINESSKDAPLNQHRPLLTQLSVVQVRGNKTALTDTSTFCPNS